MSFEQLDYEYTSSISKSITIISLMPVFLYVQNAILILIDGNHKIVQVVFIMSE